MNTPLFIAKRLIKRQSNQKGLSKPIVRIATIGIALGMAVMITSIAIVIGFQNEIREKVVGFGSHIQITNFGSGQGLSQPKLLIDQPFYPDLDTLEAVESIHQFALKEGVIETDENIQGVILKGVGSDYEWSFFRENLTAGAIPKFSDTTESKEILISDFLAQRLKISLGDRVVVYFQNAKGGMSQRNFELAGTYKSGLQELDEQFAIMDIQQVRNMNQWGVEANIRVVGCRGDSVLLRGYGFGGEGRVKLIWSEDSLRGEGPYPFCLRDDREIFVIAKAGKTVPDTAFFRYEKQGLNADNNCSCPEENEYAISTTGGSGRYYTGGFEVVLSNFEDLNRMEPLIYQHLNYDLQTTTIQQKTPEIFNWLEMLDLNSIIIIALMVLISVINMTSALLILIMERTTMIGILGALGMSISKIQQIFLFQAAYIILVGLVVGNLIGIGFCWLQSETGFLKLDPENYYVSEVPVLLKTEYLIILNVLVFLVCVLMMTLPSLAVNAIRPSKAIRFN